MSRDIEILHDATGALVRRVSIDETLGTKTVIDSNGSTTSTLSDEELNNYRQETREQAQLDRLQTKFDQLKASTLPDSTRLTVADYRQNVGPVDLRAMATLVNDLRADVIDLRSMVLDLTRLVVGMAAE